MPNLKQINSKIASLKNTSKITKAMKMIAATKLRRAQDAFVQSRAYAKKLNEALFKIEKGQDLSNPLFEARSMVKNIHLFVLTSDRGLCGGFNNTIIKKAQAFIQEKSAEGIGFAMSFCGRRGYEYFKKQNSRELTHYPDAINAPNFADAQVIGNALINAFTSGQVDEVHVVFNDFKSTLTQVPTFKQVLPVTPESGAETVKEISFLFEPDPAEIFDELVLKSIIFDVFRNLLSSSAGEHAARMTAMDAATGNCKDLIEKFTLKRNRARQAAITTELIEIISGAESLKG